MLFDRDKWQEIFHTLRQHKLRTVLTAFGVFWGIFMFSILLGAGQGLENGVTENFKKIPNAIFFWSQNATQFSYKGAPVGRRISLKQADIDAIKINMRSVDTIYGMNNIGVWGGTPAYTVYKRNSASFAIEGSYQGLEGLHFLKIKQGRYINKIDQAEKRKIAVIGQRVVERLLKDEPEPMGKIITIAGINFQIVGIYESSNHESDGSDTEKIYIPNDTLRYAFNQQHYIGSILIIPKKGVHSAIVEEQAKEILLARNLVDPRDTEVLGVWSFQRLFDQINGLFGGIEFFSWVVAVGTIMAGAIGVGNIMLIAVKERTREIGLRKALGATPASIIGMIVQETLLITSIAGYCGLVAGVLILELINKALEASGGNTSGFKNLTIDFNTAMMAVGVLIISGLFAALLPALKAVHVQPVVALQDE